MKKPTTIEEWNALAAKRKRQIPVSKKAVSKKRKDLHAVPYISPKDLPLHTVRKPTKGKFKIKSYFMTLLWKKRGTRIFEEFDCMCCNKPFSDGWKYVADNSRVYLCNKCKMCIKPQYTHILYTPMK